MEEAGINCPRVLTLTGKMVEQGLAPKDMKAEDRICLNAKEAAEFVKKYTKEFNAETLNQFGASAYDCIYVIYGAMKAAVDAGTEIPATISASDLCEILKGQLTGGFTYSGNTGDNITWEANGYVSKKAVKYDLKKAD